MRMEDRGKVIKPPIEGVVSGKIFRPSSAFRNKLWVEGILTAATIWMLAVGLWLGIAYLISLDDGWSFWTYLEIWWTPVNSWIGVIFTCLIVLTLIVVPIYINRIEYSVIAESGKTMPEIYVKKGIINITRKHVPFRTITNISSTSGPFDRLFGIGNVLIETAGFSGKMMGPEEKIEGVRFYEEVRDFILNELRKFRDPYVTGTEVVLPREEPVPRMADSLDDEMLITLREIRDVMRKLESKLGDGGQ
ncbi:MAG: PH domain-containing protein [Candidatus Thorarchaeota archaeon]